MFNQIGKNSVTLETFGGLVTLAPPNRLSEGSSPLCWDVDFLVGNVFTRAGLNSVYGSGVNSSNFTYVKTFQTLDNQIYTLAMDVLGDLWVENVTSNPGSLTNTAQFLAGMRAKSFTAFQREYICISSLTAGNFGDIPRQYTGAYFDRISQEGPGANATYTTSLTNNPASAVITSFAISSDVVTFVELTLA